MSYGFTVKAKSKKNLKELAGVEVAKIVSQQPPHAKDQLAIIKTVNAFADFIEQPLAEDESYKLSAHGSVSWNGTGELVGANIQVQVSITKDE